MEEKSLNERPHGMELLSELIRSRGKEVKFFIRTFGCQQNVSDSEKMAGMLCECGCTAADCPEQADIIIFNTCAVREHAEDRVFGNVGRIKALKESRPELIVAVGGCMVQQPQVAKRLCAMFPFVDVVFNTNELWRLPEHIFAAYTRDGKKTVDASECGDMSVREGLPVKRDGGFRAFVPVMYGCDNFCTYCVVPLVRGRERSRQPAYIVDEVKRAVEDGYRDIMLLGQNVNSYGKGLAEGIDFPQLLRRVNDIEGDFTVRFMTSHPKDATPELFEAIRDCKKISRHLHLPVQSGSDAILKRMNRRYTSGQYLSLIELARRTVPDMTFSSDIIVGFPDESADDFEDTLRLVKEVGFRSLFTFIYSKREGTPAASMPDGVSHSEKTRRLARLIEVQDGISERQELGFIGKSFRALAIGRLGDGCFEARLDDNSAVTVEGECAVNEFCDVIITERTKKRLFGKAVRHDG